MELDSKEFILVTMKESFAEVGVFINENQYFGRCFLPKTSIAKGIKSILDANNLKCPKKVYLTTRLCQTVINKRLGSPLALLTTTGFENWLDMTIPAQESFFTVELSKPKSPLQSEYIFGIDERVTASGEISRKIDVDDLEFLAAKLKLNKIEHISLCLLHSQENPENEKVAEEYLKSQGLNVYPSYNLNYDVEGARVPKTERQRWWHAVLNAYCYATFSENLEELQKDLSLTLGEDIQLRVGQDNGDFLELESVNPVNSLFSQESFLKKYLAGVIQNGNGKPRATLGCYFGLENFVSFTLEDTSLDLWKSEFGYVALNIPKQKLFQLHPTSAIDKGFWSCPTFSDKKIGWEPGPMCLGRSMNPTLIDLLFLNEQLDEIEGLSHLLNEKSKARIQETLFAYAKNEHSRSSLSSPEIIEGLSELYISSLAGHINATDYNYILCCGPLAKAIYPTLKDHLSGKQIKLVKEDFVAVKALIPGGRQ